MFQQLNRTLVLALTLGFAAPSVAVAKRGKAPPPVAAVQTAETQAAMTPREALDRLSEGNERFTSGKMLNRDLMAQVAATSTGQHPFAFVLGCVDSRVPHEVVFDQGIGDIFSARVAGNFVNTDILGSMEFAAEVAGAKAIVVLGHTSCGAVKGTCDQVELGNLTHTLSNIAPAAYAVGDAHGERSSKNSAYVEAVAEENVRMTVTNVLDRSPVLAARVEAGKLVVVGAIHDVATGEVRWLEDTLVARVD